MDVLESKSAGSGHSRDVGAARQSVVEGYTQVPTVTPLTVTDRSM